MPSKPETVLRAVEVLPDHQKTLLLAFRSYLENDKENTTRNAMNYLKVLLPFCRSIGKDKKLSDVSKEDVLQFLDSKKKSIEEDPDKKWLVTWNHYLNRLIRFYRWLHNRDIEDEEDWKTPAPFDSIKRKKNKRVSSYSANDVWSVEELLTVVKYCNSTRNKAIITGLWDMAARNHEITKPRIKDIVFREKYAEITISWDTKTGSRTIPLIVSFPYMRNWINEHPFSSQPSAFVMINNVTKKPLQPDSLWGIMNDLKQRIQKMLDNRMIKDDEDVKILTELMKKPWNPYLVGRHSSLTEKTNLLTDHQLTKYAGWVPGTKRRETYLHMSGKEVSDPLLEHYGLKEKSKPKEIRRMCPRCSFVNTVEAKVCSSCSLVLNNLAWEEVKIEEQQKEKDMQLRFSALEQQNQMMLKKMDDMAINFREALMKEQSKKQSLSD